jgi:hypothetical protein
MRCSQPCWCGVPHQGMPPGRYGGRTQRGGTRRASNTCGDFCSCQAPTRRKRCDNGTIRFVQGLRPGCGAPAEDYTETRTDLLQVRFLDASIPTGCTHSLDATAPLLDVAQLLEHPSDDAVAEPRNAVAHVLHRQAKGSNPGFSISRRSSKNATRMGPPRWE